MVPNADDATHHIVRGSGGAVEGGCEALAGVVWVGGTGPRGEGRAGHEDDPVEEEPWAADGGMGPGGRHRNCKKHKLSNLW